MRISYWSSDVCSSDLAFLDRRFEPLPHRRAERVHRWVVRHDDEHVAVAVKGDGARHDRGVSCGGGGALTPARSEEHTSELQSLMRISYAVFCLKKKKKDIALKLQELSHVRHSITHQLTIHT